jgi:hypothetical protein
MWTRNKHKHTARRPHLQQGRSTGHTPCRKDKKVNQMNLAEVQKKIDFLKGRNEYNKNNKYANDLTDRFLFLLNKNE